MQDLTLNTRMTQEDWDKLIDAEMENTRTVTFSTPSGREVKYIPLSVLREIRAEIDQYLFQNEFGSEYRKEVSQIIDKYKAEGSDKEENADSD